MVMSETYYQSNGFDPPYRSPNQHIATAAYYGRRGPFDHYHGRYHSRQHYEDVETHQDDDTNNQEEQATRRRIAVACSRCRKRKIKCTGDPGDGSGCSACKSVGTSLPYECTFIRVNSKPVEFAQLEMFTHGAYPGPSNAPTFYERDGRALERHHRSRRHVPVLHTRSAYVADLDSAHHNSPIDGYAYASSDLPRQDSLTTAYGTESLRSWSTTCSATLPPTPTYCDPYPATTYASMSYPAPQEYRRLPSVSAESLSPLNMGHLNSSLPSHGAQDRRLPVPYNTQHPQPTFPQSSPISGHGFLSQRYQLGSFSTPRIPNNANHTRNDIPWTLETGTMTRPGSISTYSTPNGLPFTSSQIMPAVSVSDVALGYHFNTAGPSASYGSYRSSPDLSPTSAHPQSHSFDSSSNSSGSGETVQRYQMANMQCYPPSSTQPEMPSHNASEAPSSSNQRAMQNITSLYSFGTASSAQQPGLQEQEDSIIPSSGVTAYSLPVRDGRHSADNDGSAHIDDGSSGYQTALHHPRPLPQHSASIDNLCRQSPLEQQPPRSATASCMSIRNFSGSYQ